MPKPKSGKVSEPLSLREKQVLALLAKGLRREQIATHLRIKAVTVDLHNKNTRKKLGAKTIVEAVVIALRKGYLQAE
ncbi:MAG: LuxR family transcriptional regulator [Rhodospirillaceae bacterium]|nr:LuxR family transcriptional regulator [Rhodospirillaceae bacterium]